MFLTLKERERTTKCRIFIMLNMHEIRFGLSFGWYWICNVWWNSLSFVRLSPFWLWIDDIVRIGQKSNEIENHILVFFYRLYSCSPQSPLIIMVNMTIDCIDFCLCLILLIISPMGFYTISWFIYRPSLKRERDK